MNKPQMFCSEYNNFDVFVEKIELNAFAYIVTASDSYVGKVAAIFRKSEHYEEYEKYLCENTFPFKNEFDYEVEFITDDDCYMLGINKITRDYFNVIAYC